jgi:hypothetical protein
MVFGFVKNLLGFKMGGVITDGKLNPTNIGVEPTPRRTPRFKINRPPMYKLGGVIKLRKKRRGCGCKKNLKPFFLGGIIKPKRNPNPNNPIVKALMNSPFNKK